MNAFYTAAAVGAICGILLGLALAGSWFSVYLGFRLGLALGGLSLVLVCVGVVALSERRKRRDGRRRRRSDRTSTPR